MQRPVDFCIWHSCGKLEIDRQSIIRHIKWQFQPMKFRHNKELYPYQHSNRDCGYFISVYLQLVVQCELKVISLPTSDLKTEAPALLGCFFSALTGLHNLNFTEFSINPFCNGRFKFACQIL